MVIEGKGIEWHGRLCLGLERNYIGQLQFREYSYTKWMIVVV